MYSKVFLEFARFKETIFATSSKTLAQCMKTGENETSEFAGLSQRVRTVECGHIVHGT